MKTSKPNPSTNETETPEEKKRRKKDKKKDTKEKHSTETETTEEKESRKKDKKEKKSFKKDKKKKNLTKTENHVEVGRFSGDTASAAAPSRLTPPRAPTRELVSNGDDLHRKPQSASGQQDYSRPGSFRVLGVEAGSADAQAIASASPARRQGRSNIASGQSASAAAASTLAPPDTPTTERGFGLVEFHGQFSSSTTEDQEPGEHYSQPGAHRVAGTLGRTFSVTVDTSISQVHSDPVPEMNQSQDITQGQFLAEANLVLEPDLVFGEPLEEPKALWRQPKVQRLFS
jgi:hypothetical protein